MLLLGFRLRLRTSVFRTLLSSHDGSGVHYGPRPWIGALMPRRPRPPCSVPGCPELTPRGGRCPAHEREANQDRASRGGAVYTTRWQRIRRAYLYANPWCLLCGRAAKVADHFPLSRRELIAWGEPNPDAPKHLRSLCVVCHNRETAKRQPGGFAAEARSRREANERPPF